VVGLAEHFRDLLIAKIPATLGILDVSDELKKRYYNQAMIAKATFLLSGLNILNQCDIDLARAKNKRLQVELALSKLTYLNRATDVDIFGNKAESQEKKTEFLNESTEKSIEIAGETIAEAPKEQSNSKSAEVIPPTASKISDSAIQAEAPIVVKTTASPVSVSPLKMTNIDAIRESIKLAEQTKAEARKNISLDGVKEIWSDYTDNNQSKSVQSALKLAILGLEEKVISAKVPTQVSRDMILQETVLLDRLRNELGVSDLVFDIQIDKSLFPDFEESKPVQSMTQREKYIVMLEKNPSLGSFTKKFGLKLDTEV
jgi:DNA polymerase-3 subunit gamma/tau